VPIARRVRRSETAAITVSIIDGSLSSDDTTIAAFPFSNSIGFHPIRTKNTCLHQAFVSTTLKRAASFRLRFFSPASFFFNDRTVRVWAESANRSFYSSRRATILSRRSSVGLTLGFRVVNVRDLTGNSRRRDACFECGRGVKRLRIRHSYSGLRFGMSEIFSRQFPRGLVLLVLQQEKQ
jgi:hypothetical protein